MTPSPLPGNPYGPDPDMLSGLDDSTLATLALAFEQRTANLIAAQKTILDCLLNPFGEYPNADSAKDAAEQLTDQINTRLGLGDDDE